LGGVSVNPLKKQWANKDDPFQDTRVFGNVFAGLELTDELQLMSRLGFNLGKQSYTDFHPIYPDQAVPDLSNHLYEGQWTSRDWTWSNTLTYSHTFGERHDLHALLGHEANQNWGRRCNAKCDNLITSDINARYIQDAICDPETKVVNSTGSKSALLSFFGKLDYNFDDRYHLNFTLRHDGSSTFGPANRWGTFPAFSVGWRLSEEPFLQKDRFFSNIMLRFGWGITGNQNVPTGRTENQFGGGIRDAYYDIDGSGDTPATGYRQTALGNPDLKWEENESMNLGLDLEFFGGAASLVVDVYQRDTDNLMFDPPQPATAGVADPPIVNIGQMRNRGIDASLGFTGDLGDGSWSVTLNGSHYKNEIVRIDGVTNFFFSPISTRFGNPVINQVGLPIGSFYGLIADGFFADQADVYAHAQQDGAAPGRIRFVDLDSNGIVTADDRTIVGSPHPDFTAGLDFEVMWGAWDLSATLFGTFGNDVWDSLKEFYVFRLFDANVRRDRLTESAIVENGVVINPDAKYPRLDYSDAFSNQLSSFYVEDGSYVRLRNVQIGYRLPLSWITGMRVYVQAENLFTVTGYPGLDPALPTWDRTGAAGDIRDQYRGVDRGTYPSNRMFSLGINATF
jgi:TonB-linked SusC/RagA family outer membrane protein